MHGGHGGHQRAGADGVPLPGHGRQAIPRLRPVHRGGLRPTQRPQDRLEPSDHGQRVQDRQRQGLRDDVEPGGPLRTVSRHGRRETAEDLHRRLRGHRRQPDVRHGRNELPGVLRAAHALPNVGAVSENSRPGHLRAASASSSCGSQARPATPTRWSGWSTTTSWPQNPTGRSLCYFTPLVGVKPYDEGISCCTSSGPRGIALIPTFAYTTAPGVVIVNLYGPSTVRLSPNDVKTKITQETRYPIDGGVDMVIEPEKPVEFESPHEGARMVPLVQGIRQRRGDPVDNPKRTVSASWPGSGKRATASGLSSRCRRVSSTARMTTRAASPLSEVRWSWHSTLSSTHTWPRRESRRRLPQTARSHWSRRRDSRRSPPTPSAARP